MDDGPHGRRCRLLQLCAAVGLEAQLAELGPCVEERVGSPEVVDPERTDEVVEAEEGARPQRVEHAHQHLAVGAGALPQDLADVFRRQIRFCQEVLHDSPALQGLHDECRQGSECGLVATDGPTTAILTEGVVTL